jgi:hypothetical protein
LRRAWRAAAGDGTSSPQTSSAATSPVHLPRSVPWILAYTSTPLPVSLSPIFALKTHWTKRQVKRHHPLRRN